MKKICFVSDFKGFSYQIDKYYIRSGEEDAMAWINRASKITLLCLEHTDTCEKIKQPEQLKLCGQLDMYERIAGLAIATYFVISHVKY